MSDVRARAWASRRLKENGLGLLFGGLFLAAPVGQSSARNAQYNQQQAAEVLDTISWWTYVRTSDVSWLAQSIAGWATYDGEQLRQRTSTVS